MAIAIIKLGDDPQAGDQKIRGEEPTPTEASP